MLGDASFRALLQVFGYLYPGYLCFKDVEHKNTDRLRLWCMYWVLMAAFTAVQPVADTFLFFVPLYYSAKLAFACYLWANNLAGADLVYNRYVQPYVVQYEPLVDSKIAEVRGLASEFLSSNFAKGVQWLQQRAVQALAAAHQAGANTLKAEPAGHAAPAAGPNLKSWDSFKSATSGGPRAFSINKEE